MRTVGFDKQKDAIVQDPAPSTVDGPSHIPKQTTDAVKETGAKVLSAVTETARGVAAPVNAKTQESLDAAKRLIGERRLQDAFAKLKAVSGERLSTEQQASADSLKAQIDQLLATTFKTATEAAGNLLKK